MRQVTLVGAARTLPVIGQGTWGMGEARARRPAEVEALRLGISLGMTLIDTAQFYGAGGAEEVVGEAIADCRDQVFVITKLWPSNAGYAPALAAVRASLARLRLERVDALLLHWPVAPALLAGTLRAFAELQASGAVGFVGVSNFDARWLRAAGRAAPPDLRLAFNQVPYALANRRVEHAVLPFAQAHEQVLMAYGPLGHGRLPSWRGYPALKALAATRGATPHQLALAFVTSRPGVVAIPKASSPAHVRSNAAAGDLALTPDEVTGLEAAFPRGSDAAQWVPPASPTLFRLVLAVERLRLRRR